MARYVCPCCAKRFNGRKCKHCFYETFTEEVGHGLHTHRGEPLVRDTPQRRSTSRRWGTPKKKSRLWIWILVFLLLDPMLELGEMLIDNLADAPVRETVPEAKPSQTAQVIYSDGQFTVYADWQAMDENGDIPVVVDNRSRKDAALSSSGVVIDGFLSEASYLSCNAPKGQMSQGYLRLNREALTLAGISQPQGVCFWLDIYETKDYDSLLQGPVPIILGQRGASSQPVAEGVPMMQTSEINIWFLEYEADDYNPEEFQDGQLLFVVENTASRELSIYTEEIRMNDAPADVSLWCSLPPNTWTICRVYLYDAPITRLQDLKSLWIDLEISDNAAESGILELAPFEISFG